MQQPNKKELWRRPRVNASLPGSRSSFNARGQSDHDLSPNMENRNSAAEPSLFDALPADGDEHRLVAPAEADSAARRVVEWTGMGRDACFMRTHGSRAWRAKPRDR